jgi:hypothetical protein
MVAHQKEHSLQLNILLDESTALMIVTEWDNKRFRFDRLTSRSHAAIQRRPKSHTALFPLRSPDALVGLPILVTLVQAMQHAFPPYVRPFVQNREIAAFKSLLFQAGKEGFRVPTAGKLEHDVCIVPRELGQLQNDRPLSLQSVSRVWTSVVDPSPWIEGTR